jgi:hypothetical protein
VSVQGVPPVTVAAAQSDSMDIDDRPVVVLAAAPIPSVAPVIVPKSFNDMTETKQEYTKAVARFRAHHAELKRAREELDKFKQSCNKNPPGVSLPNSIRPHFAKQARFTPVADDASFYKAEIESLKRLDQESSKQAFGVLITGKEKYIASLRNSVNAQQFVNNSVISYAKYIETVNALHVATDSTITVPLKEACQAFEAKLHKAIEQYNTEQVQAGLKKAKQAENNDAEENKAQERVLTGAHNGANIESIVEKKYKAMEAEKEKKHQQEIAALRQEIASLAKQPLQTSSTRPPAVSSQSNHASGKNRQNTAKGRNAPAISNQLSPRTSNTTPTAATSSKPQSAPPVKMSSSSAQVAPAGKGQKRKAEQPPIPAPTVAKDGADQDVVMHDAPIAPVASTVTEQAPVAKKQKNRHGGGRQRQAPVNQQAVPNAGGDGGANRQ